MKISHGHEILKDDRGCTVYLTRRIGRCAVQHLGVTLQVVAGYNQKKRYCGEVSGALYKYAEQSHTPSCSDMKSSGELSRLGCCVSTFVMTLRDMNSTALG